MARESAEGQAMELGWRRDNIMDLEDEDYFTMVLKKTSWLVVIYPAGATGAKRSILERFGGAEQSHDAIAGEVLGPAALILDRGRQQLIDLTDQRESGVLADALGNFDKSDHVGEQRRDLAPLARRRRLLRGVFCPTAHSVDLPGADADHPAWPRRMPR